LFISLNTALEAFVSEDLQYRFKSKLRKVSRYISVNRVVFVIRDLCFYARRLVLSLEKTRVLIPNTIDVLTCISE